MKRTDFQQQQRSKKRKTNTLKITLLLFSALFFVVVLYFANLYHKAQIAADTAFEAIEDRPSSAISREEKVQPAKDNVSILLLGIDDSEARQQGESNSRTDAIMLATLNPKERSVNLVSIPRDSYVYIPEIGKRDKIAHAYQYGGVRSTVETVEELLEIPIDYYIRMNFNAFIDVVDELGGITVEVPYERIEKDENDGNNIHLQPGIQTLDGRHALALARTRKLDSDVDRGKRQQMIVQAMVDKALEASSFFKYGNVIEAIGNNMKTNMTFREMLSFLEYGKGGLPRVDNHVLEGEDDWTYGYYYTIDEENLADLKFILQRHLKLRSPSTSSTLSTAISNTNDS
ncbi:LCP family protein [Savagea sp. SN6]|uniref:LCP family protein n=1 Tax=Savagea serpentis TaxID=2785297 RepID=A0A8J7G8W5_9BACL|nr:LCP family protein [Savagea serpentis]MBF4501333.1 LCP family protein [Savagea serpentis]